jgi:hypothetical protein
MLRLLAIILLAAAVHAQIVDGHIVSATTGVDVPGIKVDLLQDDIAYSAITDGQGRFRIDSVKDGTYTLHYYDEARRFWTIPGRADVVQLAPIHVTAGNPVHLDVKMQPLARLSGRVLDAEGSPLANAPVWVLRQNVQCNPPSCFTVLRELKTGEKGEYSVANVEDAGPWLLSAAATTGSPQTFYPGAGDPQLADRLVVEQGRELWNLDIKLAQATLHRVRGHLLDPAGEKMAGVSVTLYNGLGSVLHRDTDKDGSFEFPAVAEGEWRISAAAKRDAVTLWAAQQLRVKGRDVDNFELRVNAPFSLRGKVVMEVPEGMSPPDPPSAVIVSYAGSGTVEGMPPVPLGRTDDHGNFTVGSMYAGSYFIVVPASPPPPYYLDSIRLGTADALTGDVPIVSGSLPLTVTYKIGGGSVQGAIDSCGAARVMLMPVDPILRRHGFQRGTQCGPNGQFEFAAVRPGEYYAIAVAPDSSGRWLTAITEDSLLSRRGIKVTVRANEHTSAEIRVAKW